MLRSNFILSWRRFLVVDVIMDNYSRFSLGNAILQNKRGSYTLRTIIKSRNDRVTLLIFCRIWVCFMLFWIVRRTLQQIWLNRRLMSTLCWWNISIRLETASNIAIQIKSIDITARTMNQWKTFSHCSRSTFKQWLKLISRLRDRRMAGHYYILLYQKAMQTLLRLSLLPRQIPMLKLRFTILARQSRDF